MNNQNKGLIIIGKERTGKSMLQRFIANTHNKEEVFWINGWSMGDHDFTGCPKNVKLIVVDNMKAKYIDIILGAVSGDIEVNNIGEYPFTIPASQFRFVINTEELSMSDVIAESISNRFEIIEVADCGYKAIQRQKQLFNNYDNGANQNPKI